MLSKTGILLIIMLALAIPAYAQDATDIPTPALTAEEETITIPPEHVLYNAKILVEDVQEALTFDPARKALLKQKHLNTRTRELQYDAVKNNNKNAAKILKRLQTKRMELDEALENMKPKCADVETGEITPCKEFSSDSANKRIYDGLKRQNTDVLTRLLSSEKMPEQSKTGLRNAIEWSGLKVDEKVETDKGEVVQANMTQSFRSTAISYVPFKTASIYLKKTNTWYSIIVNADSVTISDEITLSSPQYYLYPTESQMNELVKIANNINANKRMAWKDSIRIMNLWMEISKRKA
jgi:hypothetical protein